MNPSNGRSLEKEIASFEYKRNRAAKGPCRDSKGKEREAATATSEESEIELQPAENRKKRKAPKGFKVDGDVEFLEEKDILVKYLYQISKFCLFK